MNWLETKARKQLTFSLSHWGTARKKVIWMLSALGKFGIFQEKKKQNKQQTNKHLLLEHWDYLKVLLSFKMKQNVTSCCLYKKIPSTISKASGLYLPLNAFFRSIMVYRLTLLFLNPWAKPEYIQYFAPHPSLYNNLKPELN